MQALRFSALYQVSSQQNATLTKALDRCGRGPADPSPITRTLGSIAGEPGLKNDDWSLHPVSLNFDLDTGRCPDGYYLMTRKDQDDVAGFQRFQERHQRSMSGYEQVAAYVEQNRARLEHIG